MISILLNFTSKYISMFFDLKIILIDFSFWKQLLRDFLRSCPPDFLRPKIEPPQALPFFILHGNLKVGPQSLERSNPITKLGQSPWACVQNMWINKNFTQTDSLHHQGLTDLLPHVHNIRNNKLFKTTTPGPHFIWFQFYWILHPSISVCFSILK